MSPLVPTVCLLRELFVEVSTLVTLDSWAVFGAWHKNVWDNSIQQRWRRHPRPGAQDNFSKVEVGMYGDGTGDRRVNGWRAVLSSGKNIPDPDPLRIERI